MASFPDSVGAAVDFADSAVDPVPDSVAPDHLHLALLLLVLNHFLNYSQVISRLIISGIQS